METDAEQPAKPAEQKSVHTALSDKPLLLRELFNAAVDAVAGEPATRRALQDQETAGRLAGHPIHLVAVGKAADAMTQGALAVLGDRLQQGLVITKHGHLGTALISDERLQCHEAGHPRPDQASLQAGAALVEFISELPEGARLVFLVSGGASSLVEHLISGATLDDLQAVTSRLLAEGHPIGQMNQVRRHLSRIKGGRLAAFLPKVEVVQLLISDVPGDVPGDIGSGLLIPPEPATKATLSLCESLLERSWLEQQFAAPSAEDPCWLRMQTRIIASSDIAQQAVVDAARERSLHVVRSNGLLDGDMPTVVDRLAAELSAPDAAAGLYVWGGEPTVRLPSDPGRGGRNQHLALALAERLALADGQVSGRWVGR